MGKRYRVKKHYVVRGRGGVFKKWTNIGKSIFVDKRKKAKKVKKCYGHIGDLYN